MEEIEKDSRFAHLPKDPRFKPNFKQKKVKIDSRFKSMLQDKEFNVKFLDKRGRPVNSSTKQDLRRLYDYESEEEEDSSEEDKSEDNESDREESSVEKKDEEVSEEKEDEEGNKELDPADDEDTENGESQEAVEEDSEPEADDNDDFPDLTGDGPDYARGVGVLESSDDEQANEEELEDEEEFLNHNWNEPDHNAPEAEEITARLALCNMDWDRIGARDLYVLFNSFVPQGGAVQSVTIYPSELGRKRLEEEKNEGIGKHLEEEDRRVANSSGHTGKLDWGNRLRQYQLERLAYHYAVIVCDSKETASMIYEECDTMEYEKSSCCIDLRFIPEGMAFDETPKDSCSGMSNLSSFTPTTFVTAAFCQANVQVTWDEQDTERQAATTQKNFSEEYFLSNDDLYFDPDTKYSTEKPKNKKYVDNYRRLLNLEEDESEKKKKNDLPPLVGSGSESEDEEEQQPLELLGEKSEDEEEIHSDADVSSDKKKKRKADIYSDKKTEHNLDASDEGEVEMQYSWQPSTKQQTLKMQAKKKLTPWEEYQQKKREKKKQKKRERELEKLREQGIEDTTDLGFDDEFFNDEPSEGEKDKKRDKKKRNKKKKKQEAADKEEDEAEKKERASLALLMKDDDDKRKHFSLLQIMKEESESQKKGKKRKQSEDVAMDSIEVKLDQSRFASLYTDPDMHIDPNAPEFKKTKGMMTLMEEVSKKRKTN